MSRSCDLLQMPCLDILPFMESVDRPRNVNPQERAPAVKRWEHFDYEERDEVATLTFSRPERLNSLTFEVYADIRELTDSLRNRQDVRVFVIRGTGRGFCSGGDVDEIIAELLKRGI